MLLAQRFFLGAFAASLVWLALVATDWGWYGDAWVPVLAAGWLSSVFSRTCRDLSRVTSRGTIGGSPGPSGATTPQRRPRWARSRATR